MRNLKPFLKLELKGVKNENGTVQDFSGNGNHGTITNATIVDGRNGQAMRFDGTDDKVVVSDNSAIQNIFDGGGSISCWVKPNSDGEGNFGRIINKSDRTTNGWLFSVSYESNGKVKIELYYFFSDTVGYWLSTNAEVPIGSWSFIVITYDNSSTSNDPIIYVNGNVKSLTEDSAPIGTRDSDIGEDIYIGDDTGSSNCFDGDIQDLRFYNTELTADEVEAIYKQNIRSSALVPVGKFRNYMEFDGSNDGISIAHASQVGLNMGTSDFLISLWFKTTNDGYLINKKDGTTAWQFQVFSHVVKGWIGDGTNSAGVESSTSVDIGKWYHTIFSMDKSSATGNVIYLDNVDVSNNRDDPSGVGDLDNTESVDVGRRSDDSNYFTDNIANVRVFNFGKDGLPTGTAFTNLIKGLYEKPNAPLSEYDSDLAPYEDADRTELVTNGTFDADSDWTKAGNITINGGAAHFNNEVLNTSLTQTIAFPQGKKLVVEFTISNISGGGIKINVGGNHESSAFTTNGTHFFIPSGTSYTNTNFYIQSSADSTTCDVDDVSLKRVGEVAHWKLDESNGFKAIDQTSNSNDLTQTTVANQPAIIQDLEVKKSLEPVFYEPLKTASLKDWTVVSGAFEPVMGHFGGGTSTLGNELVVNGTFDSGGYYPWTSEGSTTIAVVDDGGYVLECTQSGVTSIWVYESPATTYTAGKWYKVSFRAKSISGNTNLALSRLTVDGTSYNFGGTITGSWVNYTYYIKMTKSGTAYVIFRLDNTGVYRIDDVSVKECQEPTQYGIKCTTAGTCGIVVPVQLQDLTKNRWEWTWKMYKGADANHAKVGFILDNIGFAASQEGYSFKFVATEAVVLTENSGGIPSDIASSAASYINNSQWYDCKVTRSAAGAFTFYVDGTIVNVSGGSGTNPVTDTTTTTAKYIVLDIDANDIVSLIRISRY